MPSQQGIETYLESLGFEAVKIRPVDRTEWNVPSSWVVEVADGEKWTPWIVVAALGSDEGGPSPALLRHAEAQRVRYVLLAAGDVVEWYAMTGARSLRLAVPPRAPTEPILQSVTLHNGLMLTLTELAGKLVPDSLAETDWGYLLAVVANQLRAPTPSGTQTQRHLQVQEMASRFQTALGGGGLWELDPYVMERLDRAARVVERYDLHNLHPELVHRGFDAFCRSHLGEKSFHVGVVKAFVARYLMNLRSSEPAPRHSLYYRCGTGEFVSAVAGDPAEIDSLTIVDERLSAAQLSALRLSLAWGNPDPVLRLCEFRRVLPLTPYPKYELVFANLVDPISRYVGNPWRPDWYSEIISDLWSQVVSGGRLLLLVPDVFLSGETFERVRQELSARSSIDLIAKLPESALAVGDAGISLIECVRGEYRGRDLAPVMLSVSIESENQVKPTATEVQETIRSQVAKENVWIEFDATLERLDPHFYQLGRTGTPIRQYQQVQLGRYCKVISGYSNVPAVPDKAAVRQVPAGAIRDLSIDVRACKQIAPGSRRARALLAPGDVLFTLKGSPGRAAVVPRELSGSVPGENVAVIHAGEMVLPTYLAMLLDSELGSDLIRPWIKGSVIRYMTLRDLHRLEIPLPALEVQRQLVREHEEIADQLRAFRSVVAEKERAIRALPGMRLRGN